MPLTLKIKKNRLYLPHGNSSSVKKIVERTFSAFFMMSTPIFSSLLEVVILSNSWLAYNSATPPPFERGKKIHINKTSKNELHKMALKTYFLIELQSWKAPILLPKFFSVVPDCMTLLHTNSWRKSN